MPRPAASSRKNQHSNRHENGLVVPGKRVSKQKSNGQINGSANNSTTNKGSSTNADPSSRRPLSAQSVTPPVVNKLDASAGDIEMECIGGSKANGYGKSSFDMSYGPPPNSAAPNGDASVADADPEDQQLPRRSDKATSTKKSASNSINPFILASSILKSCPMYDTIAILIFLLQLPPIVLTLVQFLFASLTFMPPAGTTTASLTSNFDIFQGPAGTPSLGTMIAMDGVCLLVWGLFMWSWAQNFALDLAHVQVAITLGGGSSGKNGGVNALCVFIVLILHLFRSRGVQDFVLGHLLSANILSPDMLSQYSNMIPTEFRRAGEPSSPSWARSLLAVHILAQAGTAMARRSMAKNRSSPPSKSGKRTDTEASAGSQAQVDSSAFESGPISTVGLDNQMPGPSALKENRDRMISAKKRRRQANQVRSRQPFWAALASTKVTVMREYEHSRATTKATRLEAISEDDLHGANLEGGLIWITEVDGSSVRFAASEFYSFQSEEPPVSGMYENEPLSLDDNTEPFFVCVNGAHWATATICKVHQDLGQPGAVQWRGKISGLAPNCTYTCSFIRRSNQEEISAVSVKTPPAPDTEQAVSSMSASPRQSLRPSSPTSTMRNSIANAENKLNDRRSRLKRSKADHKVHLTKLRKELDSFNNRLKSTGDDNRQKQRSLQLERNIKQTEEASAAIDAELEGLENVPQEELEDWATQKTAFDQELEKLNIAKKELAAAKAASSRDVSAVESELASTVQRRERLQSRRSRLSEQHERITTANAQGLNERERRATEQFAKEQDQAMVEEGFKEQLSNISRSIHDYQMRTSQLWQQASVLEQNFQQQQQQQQLKMLLNNGPLTPEGNLPGTNPQPPAPSSAVMASGPTARPTMGLSFPAFNPNDKPMASTGTRQLASPINSVPASPAARQPQFANPQFTITNQFFGFDQFTPRERASSNLSGRASLNADVDIWDTNRIPTLPEDRPSATPEIGRRTLLGGIGSSATFGAPGPVTGFTSSTSPFVRAGSNGSGRSGSGSGSGSGSPSSARGKGHSN